MANAAEDRGLRYWWQQVWPLLQVTAAAVVAWIIALQFSNHADPFFAPIAAVVALSAPTGERGLQAVRIILGVLLGIFVGETTVALLGGGYGRLALARFVAMAIARLAGAARIVMVQAAVGAILTVIAAGGEAGIHRLIDAGIGGGVALLFSQILFSPEPVTLLRQAEKNGLFHIANGLRHAADAIEAGETGSPEAAIAQLRVRESMNELERLRSASRNVARRTVGWRLQIESVKREREHAYQVEMLGSSAVVLIRMAYAADAAVARSVVTPIRELAGIIDELARNLGLRINRRTAIERSLQVVRSLGITEEPTTPALLTLKNMIAMAATDVIVFAGLTHTEAARLVGAETMEFTLPRSPAAARLPFGLDRVVRHATKSRLARKLARRKSKRADVDREESAG